MSAFPPHKFQVSRPINSEYALSILQAYLANSASQPYLLPNATLQPTGPSAQDASSNITVHNLKRVEAGLRGEWLAPSLELDGIAEGAYEDGSFPEAGVVEAHDEQASEDEWQDPDEYKREQSSVEGEIGNREAVITQGKKDDTVPLNVGATAKALDKAARKDAKKKKKDEERKQRHNINKQ